jgi:hypothetical protein
MHAAKLPSSLDFQLLQISEDAECAGYLRTSLEEASELQLASAATIARAGTKIWIFAR